MQRYFVNDTENIQEKICFTGNDFHHMTKVMRMNIGSQIIALFPNGREAIFEITKIIHDRLEATLIKELEGNRELPISVTIATGLPKADKFEWIIQKGTELGAVEFIPVQTERTIVKIDEKKLMNKMNRWEKIAKEAAEQSERNRIPKINKPCTFQQLLTVSERFKHKLVAYEEEGRSGEKKNFVKVLEQIKKSESLLVVVGPEGGFSKKEIEALTSHQFTICGLGPRILRAETAPLYILSSISFYFELMR